MKFSDFSRLLTFEIKLSLDSPEDFSMMDVPRGTELSLDLAFSMN